MAIRGPKPKPTHLKVITGNPGKRPLPANEPQPQPLSKIPDAPTHLNADAKREWRRLCKELHRLGLLTRLDRGPMAAYCQAYGVWCEAERALEDAKRDPKATAGGLLIETSNGNLIQNPLVGLARRAKYDMVRYATEFGLTPSSRTRVNDNAPEAAKKAAAGSFFDD